MGLMTAQEVRNRAVFCAQVGKVRSGEKGGGGERSEREITRKTGTTLGSFGG